MAVTQDEERADKISPSLTISIHNMVQGFINKDFDNFVTPVLYKNSDKGMRYCQYEIMNQHKGDDILVANGLRLDRISGGTRYPTIIKGTKTKKPIDRLETELKKRITKDLRNAWCETATQAGKVSATTLKKPMLLHKWEKQKKKIIYPCYAQPKHDGIRCLYDSKTGKLYSRSGKVVALPHITDALKEFGAVSLDGEVAFEDFTVPLPEVIHAISAQDINLKFHVFDNLHGSSIDQGFEDRFVNRVAGWFKEESLSSVIGICITATKKFENEDEIDAYYEAATSAGMEGIVIRNTDSPYQFGKRTMFTLKYKLEYEEKFLIEGYQIIQHPEGDLIQFVCTFNGKQFEVVPAWKHSERRECLAAFHGEVSREPSITYMVSGLPTMLIEYRGITPDGKPYHAVGKTTWKNFKKLLKG